MNPYARRFLTTLTMTTAAIAADPAPAEDPYQWLEEVDSEAALDWVETRNQIAIDELTDDPRYEETRDGLLEIYNSRDRIPGVSLYGDYYYNFWQDAEHVRGIWRRCSPESYATDSPAWETVIDLDKLADVEEVSWVWKGAVVQDLNYQRALLILSDGGQDASEYREFDLRTLAFVDEGFRLETGRNRADWIDADTLLVGAFVTADDATVSGYPRKIRIWQRGTALKDAPVVHTIDPEEVGAFLSVTGNASGRRSYIHHAVTGNETLFWLIEADQSVSPIKVPRKSGIGFFQDQLLVELRSDWTLDEVTYPSGALLATNLASFQNGGREFEILFAPEARVSLDSYATTKNMVVLNLLNNVNGQVRFLRRTTVGWEPGALATAAIGNAAARAVDSDLSDKVFLTTANFLEPTTLSLADLATGEKMVLKRTPEFFDKSGLVMTQHEATAPDGTKIPYFQVARAALKLDGSNPTLLSGYGGFQIPMRPSYSGSWGRAWLTQGGVYILANIRGGGEFGPNWHQAALQENRQVSWNDFIAIGEDLVERGVTSPAHLGIMGGSQGGLLVGVAYTQRPDLWGAVVCQVPLLDMLRFHKLLAGASWMGEYGNPDIPAEHEFLAAYSPYQNISAHANYPRILFVTSTHDDRVHPAHARKMAARLEEYGHDFLYWENTEGGHGGAANNAERAQLWGLSFTFLWRELSGGKTD